MRWKHYIPLLCFGAISCYKSVDATSEKTAEPVEIITTQKEFVAGEPIQLQFDGAADNQLLLIENAWGTIGLRPDTTNTQLTFSLPASISQKSGLNHWILIQEKRKIAKGDFTIFASKELSNAMESYVGPTSIFADNKDKAMIVSLPQDVYGNPLTNGTTIELTEKFKANQESYSVNVQDMIGFDFIGGHRKVGDIFITSTLDNQVSKEFTISVVPTKAADFTITSERQHSFADGNQIVSFKTSVINDRNGNKIADGTLVNFVIEDASGNSYQTYGQTLNGLAVGKMLHPEAPTQWNVKAHISGLSQSNHLELAFDAAVLDYSVHISEDGRAITVGPILSYMKQLVPDGMGIHLEIEDSRGELPYTQKITSRKGIGRFELPQSMDANQNTVKITVAGIEKIIKHKKS